MLPALKFVQGAVARKDFVPSLTHFRIANGFVKGFNGSLGICSPIDLDLDISPKAVQFVKAIAACTETISMHVAQNGKLVISSGNFRAHIECDDPKNFPDILPGGRTIKPSGDMIPALAYLEPFIAVDASRPWACGILFDGESAFATNNIVLVQYWLGFTFPNRVNIPESAVRELIRIGESPARIQVSDTRITFHYEDGRWISTQLLHAEWPDVITLLDKFDAAPEPVAGEFWEALAQLLPFVDEAGRVYFHGDKIATGKEPDLAGIAVQVSCPSAGIFNAKQLSNLRLVANSISFAAYPAPVPFSGERSRGVIVGLRET